MPIVIHPHRELRTVLLLAATLGCMLAMIAPSAAMAAPGPASMLKPKQQPRTLERPTKTRTEIGVRFTSSIDGEITGMRMYRAPGGRKGLYRASLWTGAGRRVSTRSFRIRNGRGWQTVRFRRPVTITAGRSYVASYSSPRGFHARTRNGFRTTTATGSLKVAELVGGVWRRGAGFPTRGPRSTNNWVDVLVTPRESAPPTETIPPPLVAPNPGVPFPPGSVMPPSTAADPVPGYPNATTTGVPAGTSLDTYTGSCKITVANTVIDSMIVNCPTLDILAANVQIRSSRIYGNVGLRYVNSDNSFTIEDSEVILGMTNNTGLGNANFTARRVHVTGGRRSAYCDHSCVIEDSYMHAQQTDALQEQHMGGVRMSQLLVLHHNTIACEAPRGPGAGCSAALTGYGDFEPVQFNLIEGNIFYGSDGGQASSCVRGGSTAPGSKPYATEANNIRFIDNVFVRGANGQCGVHGPVIGFDVTRPGNEWLGNVWDDGTPVVARN